MAYSTKFRGTLIWDNPLIFYSGSYGGQADKTVFDDIFLPRQNEKIINLQLVAWCHENPENAKNLVKWSEKYTCNKNHRIIFFANSELEAQAIRDAGGESFFMHQNALVDSNLFKIICLDIAEKKYNAVYNAQFLSFKRHELASKIKKLALLSYHMDPLYYSDVILNLPEYTLANKLLPDNGLSWLGYNEVNNIYNDSYCGLCLSSEEGGMHASMEYLLAGIPVVSTESKGGRDFFFNSTNSIIVPDDSQAVLDAVNYYCNNLTIDKMWEIRIDAIKMQNRELLKYKKLINTLLSSFGVDINVDLLWEHIYRDKLIGHEDLDVFFQNGISNLKDVINN